MRGRRSTASSSVGGSEESPSVNGSSNSSGWSCTSCTFLNSNSSYACELCQSKKPTSRSRGVSGRSVSTDLDQPPPLLSPSLSQSSFTLDDSTASAHSLESTPAPTTAKKRKRKPFLRELVDFENFRQLDVTVGEKTISIRDYAIKPKYALIPNNPISAE